MTDKFKHYIDKGAYTNTPYFRVLDVCWALLSDVVYKPVNEIEMKLRSNAMKNSQSMAVFYSQAEKLHHLRHRAINADEVFGLIVQEHQTNSIHSGSKTFKVLN